MVEIFGEVHRVLADHGTVWLNLGDSYNTQQAGNKTPSGFSQTRPSRISGNGDQETVKHGRGLIGGGLKPKDLVGVPWRVALALQDNGWYLRSDIIWNKMNPLPESVTDRPTKAHEYIFLLSKLPHYYFDQEAVREPAEWNRWGDQTNAKYEGSDTATGWISTKTKEELNANRTSYPSGQTSGNSLLGHTQKGSGGLPVNPAGRNIRSVWNIPTMPYAEAHFATFSPELPRRAIKAGCPPQVCCTCGKPRQRIIETSGGRDWRSDRMVEVGIPGAYAGEGSKKRGRSKEPLSNTKDRTDLGFSDCGHENYRVGVVLDLFMGSGTTAVVARELERHSVGIELSTEYCTLIAKRLAQQSLLA